MWEETWIILVFIRQLWLCIVNLTILMSCSLAGDILCAVDRIIYDLWRHISYFLYVFSNANILLYNVTCYALFSDKWNLNVYIIPISLTFFFSNLMIHFHNSSPNRTAYFFLCGICKDIQTHRFNYNYLTKFRNSKI